MVRSLVIFLFFTLLFWPQILRADASYWGGTGLLQIPNGRIIGDGDLRISISQNYPYRTFSSTFGFLPFLELNGRLTEVLDAEITSPGWEGYVITKINLLILNFSCYKNITGGHHLLLALKIFTAQNFFTQNISQ